MATNATLIAAGFSVGGTDESGSVSFYERTDESGRVIVADYDPLDGWGCSVYANETDRLAERNSIAYVDTGDPRPETLIEYIRAEFPGLLIG